MDDIYFFGRTETDDEAAVDVYQISLDDYEVFFETELSIDACCDVVSDSLEVADNDLMCNCLTAALLVVLAARCVRILFSDFSS